MHVAPISLGRTVRTREVGGFVLVESAYAPQAVLPRHFHERASFSTPLRGSFLESVGTRTIDCSAGEVLVRPAGEVHSNRYGGNGARCLLVEVQPERLASLRGFTSLFDAPSTLPREIAVLARRVHAELAASDDAAPIAIEALMLEIIAGATRQSSGKPNWLERARAFVHTHASTKLTLGSIAEAAGVHPATLARGFRAHLRCSPAEYVRRLRLDAAMRALATTDAPIADIALDAGFYDQSHFTGAFRRHSGMTPARYRALRRSS